MSTTWRLEELEHLGRCPICRHADRVSAYRGLTDTLFRCSDDHWDMYACVQCDTHYLDPRPNEETIARAYSTYLTHHVPDYGGLSARDDAAGGRLVTVLRGLANGYRNARWGTQVRPELRLGRYVVACVPPLRDALAQQLRNLPGRPPSPSAILLDVGCGNGAFLQLARSAGWRVKGIDFDEVAVSKARAVGLDVQQGGLQQLHAECAGTFQWITLSHVLEHVHEPVAWVQALHRILEPGGTLWLQTPNIRSLGHMRFGRSWIGIDAPRHLTLWTKETLIRVLADAGFSGVRVLPTPALAAMEWYAGSEGIRRGMDYGAITSTRWWKRLQRRDVWPALRQHWSTGHAEFLTVVATA